MLTPINDEKGVVEATTVPTTASIPSTVIALSVDTSTDGDSLYIVPAGRYAIVRNVSVTSAGSTTPESGLLRINAVTAFRFDSFSGATFNPIALPEGTAIGLIATTGEDVYATIEVYDVNN